MRRIGLVILLVLIVAGWLMVGRGRRTAARIEDFDAVEWRAGLDRRMAELRLAGMSVAQAVEELTRRTGTRIVIAPGLAGQQVWQPRWKYGVTTWAQRRVDLEGEDVSLADVLDVLIGAEAAQYPTAGYAAMADGTIAVDFEDALPHVVRTYDVGGLIPKQVRPERAAMAGAGLIGSISPRQVSSYAPRRRVKAWYVGGRLVVVETLRGHARVRRVLERMRMRMSALSVNARVDLAIRVPPVPLPAE